jgi:hypothetical protein
MYPACLATMALIAASATSTGGVAAFVAKSFMRQRRAGRDSGRPWSGQGGTQFPETVIPVDDKFAVQARLRWKPSALLER